jgi:hypothetical protein
MPYIKDTFSILAECAAIDLPDTQRVVRESEVRVGYEDIEEAADYYCITAEMVPVIQIGNEFYTEAQLLAPFMRDAGIKSMMEALDCIAEANNLPAKSVGLLIESSKSVSDIIDKHVKDSKKKLDSHIKDSKKKLDTHVDNSGKKLDAVMNKIGKATDLAKELKSKGYPVKRKKSKLNEADMKTADDFRKKKQDEKKKEWDSVKKANERYDNKTYYDHDKNGNKTYNPNTIKKDSEYRKNSKAVSDHEDKYGTHGKNVGGTNTRNHINATYAKERHDRRHGTKESVEDLFNF